MLILSKTIVIDAGHGGFDPGAVYGTAREKDFTLAIALQLRHLLEASGIHVLMTRTTDAAPGNTTTKNEELKERVRIANENEADLFVSIHINAMGTGQQAHGSEIYVYEGGENIYGLVSSISRNIGAVMGYHGEPIKDGSGFYVIKHTNCPAMLIEIGFIDSSDLNKIQANINNFAGMIAAPLIPWGDGNPNEVAPPIIYDYAGTEYETAIEFVKEKGIMLGYSDSVFGVNDSLTRGQAALILYRLLGGESHADNGTTE